MINDLMNQTIEDSRWNITIIKGSHRIYVRRFAPHLPLRWSKRIINQDHARS